MSTGRGLSLQFFFIIRKNKLVLSGTPIVGLGDLVFIMLCLKTVDDGKRMTDWAIVIDCLE
jgi:hypothetical protein